MLDISSTPYLGQTIILCSCVFFAFASYAILLSAFFPTTGILVRALLLVFSNILTGQQWVDVVAKDDHYKYLILFIIPTGSYFVIANWVGWQYYRNS